MEYRTTWNIGLHRKQSNTWNTGLHGKQDYMGGLWDTGIYGIKDCIGYRNIWDTGLHGMMRYRTTCDTRIDLVVENEDLMLQSNLIFYC